MMTILKNVFLCCVMLSFSLTCMASVEEIEKLGFEKLSPSRSTWNLQNYMYFKTLKPDVKYQVTVLAPHNKWSDHKTHPQVLQWKGLVHSDAKGQIELGAQVVSSIAGRSLNSLESAHSDFLFWRLKDDLDWGQLSEEEQSLASFLKNQSPKSEKFYAFFLVKDLNSKTTVKSFYQEFYKVSPKVTIKAINPEKENFIGQVFYPEGFHERNAKKYKALVLWGGSSSRAPAHIAKAFASQGHIVVTLRYFSYVASTDGVSEGHLSHNLQAIPIERFALPVKFLTQKLGVPAKNISVSGASRGGEAALLFASHLANDLGITRVVARHPIDVALSDKATVNLGIVDEGSAWTLNGEQIAFNSMGPHKQLDSLAYELSENQRNKNLVDFNEHKDIPLVSLTAAYKDFLKTPPTAETGRIDLSHYKGSLYTTAGGFDGFWPSAPAVKRIRTQRKDAGKLAQDHHIILSKAGHSSSFERSSVLSKANWLFFKDRSAPSDKAFRIYPRSLNSKGEAVTDPLSEAAFDLLNYLQLKYAVENLSKAHPAYKNFSKIFPELLE